MRGALSFTVSIDSYSLLCFYAHMCRLSERLSAGLYAGVVGACFWFCVLVTSLTIKERNIYVSVIVWATLLISRQPKPVSGYRTQHQTKPRCYEQGLRMVTLSQFPTLLGVLVRRSEARSYALRCRRWL